MPATVRRRSSISRKDMWQPEQPSSHTVARRFLLIQPRSPRRTRRYTKETFHRGRSRRKLLPMNSFVKLRVLRGSSFSFVFFPHHGQVRQELPPLEHFGDRAPFFKQRAGRTYVNALAATGAGFGRSPGFIQVGDDLGVDAAAHDVPGMRSFNFVAD